MGELPSLIFRMTASLHCAARISAVGSGPARGRPAVCSAKKLGVATARLRNQAEPGSSEFHHMLLDLGEGARWLKEKSLGLQRGLQACPCSVRSERMRKVRAHRDRTLNEENPPRRARTKIVRANKKRTQHFCCVASSRARTSDLQIFSLTLSQLSY